MARVFFTPIEKKMLKVLDDGDRHRFEELHECCKPSSRHQVHEHLANIRRKLKNLGHGVVCCFGLGKSFWYQRVVFYTPDDE